MLSKTCQYAIRSLIYICSKSNIGERANLGEIAKAIDSPYAFTSKILQRLVKSEIVDSYRGGSGGFSVNPKKMGKITVGQIVDSIEGEDFHRGCFLGLPQCSDQKPCPIHNEYKVLRREMKNKLFNLSFDDIIGHPDVLK